MKATLKRLISSSTTTIVLLLVYGAGWAIATFIEKYQGSEVARSVVYLRGEKRNVSICGRLEND